ncbi:hypothetical protein JW756_06860 [Candidatus Woesearchaeota archaeon]|nr:hypothetical protein [Candidatus Woesearchaeota archaeon]
MSATNTGNEFDELVNQLNQWLVSNENALRYKQRVKKRRKESFWRGFFSVFGIRYSKSAREDDLAYRHPVYDRKDLSGEQMDCVCLASDLIRTINTLEKIISGETDNLNFSAADAKIGKRASEEMYSGLRQKYFLAAGKQV